MINFIKNIFLLALLIICSSKIVGLDHRQFLSLLQQSYPPITFEDKQMRMESFIKTGTLPILLEQEQVKIAFDILFSFDEKGKKDAKENHERKIIEDGAFKEFNFFYGNVKNPGKHILNFLNRTKTKMGYVNLGYKLTQLTNNQEKLKKEQDILKTLMDNEKLRKDIECNLNYFALYEPHLQFLYNLEYPILLHAAHLYFNKLPEKINTKLNKDELVLFLGNIYLVTDLLTNLLVAFAGIPDIYRKMEASFYNRNYRAYLKTSLASSAYSTAIMFSLINLYKDFQMKKFVKAINDQVQAVRHTLIVAQNIYNLVKDNPILCANIDSISNIKRFFDNQSKSCKEFIKLTNKKGLFAGLLKVDATILSAFKYAIEMQKELLPLMKAIADIDMYTSVSNLIEDHKNAANKLCFATFVDNKVPFVSAKKVWNILLNPDKAVANNINLGAAAYKGHNMIITGANESGKSTFQKTMIVSLMFAHVFGIACAESFEISTFDRIKFYQNIQDDIVDGKSLFRAQAEHFNKLFINDPNEICYISSDEPATGANARICAAIAFAAAKELVNARNCACILSTHFPLLAELEEQTDGFFKNYKFGVIRDSNGKIIYPYKLSEGISDQHIELEVFQKEGLKSSILENARQMLDQKEDMKLIKRRSKL